MSLINKKSISVLFILIGLAGAYFVYRHLHPTYIPKPREEVTLTIIPGWNLRQVADYLVQKGFASSTEDVYKITGEPAYDYRASKLQVATLFDFSDRPLFSDRGGMSYEGYLYPETINSYKDASLSDVISRFVSLEQDEWNASDFKQISGTKHSLHDILTMASILEKETKTANDRRLVADILWRRISKGWALQVDSSVHYAVDKTGNVFTTDKERQIDSPWNTYKYPGLPPGPICNPGFDSIMAAINPTPNVYWYFLSGKDGQMHYAKTLEEHNRNKQYL